MTNTQSINKHFCVKRSMCTKSAFNIMFQVCGIALATVLVSSASYAIQDGPHLELPKHQSVDEYNVNLVGNQVSPTVKTVSIGGALGIQHSISMVGNYLDFDRTLYGYIDKYAGSLKRAELASGNYMPDGVKPLDRINVMRASFLGQSADFFFKKNDGTYMAVPEGTDIVYEATGDKRHKLSRDLVWTQPDGTQVYFSGDSVEKIVYPNGFTINVSGGISTNTGYALDFFYDANDPGLDASKESKRYSFPSGSTALRAPSSSAWRAANPKCVFAINTTVEKPYLPAPRSCDAPNKWPVAKFLWPGGMGLAIFIDRTTISVIDQAGSKTDFIYEANDAGATYYGVPIYQVNKYVPGELISPRLVEVISAGATSPTVRYKYKEPDWNGDEGFRDYLLHGVLREASGVLGTVSYSTSSMRDNGGAQYYSSDRQVEQVYAPEKARVRLIDGKTARTIKYEYNYRNFPLVEEFDFKSRKKQYEYDARGNLIKVIEGALISEAGYPSTCVHPKTCNQPIWVRDANGNTTIYTYHQDSGQVESVTSPADARGVSAQTRYQYSALSATYYDSKGNKITGSPIWLKTAEKYCTDTNYTGTGDGKGNFTGACAAGGQEVVTRYEYHSDNLLLTGQVVEADGIKRRTCFRYDIYGNQIAKTEPKAGLASCPK